jgi:hypothetical protein
VEELIIEVRAADVLEKVKQHRKRYQKSYAALLRAFDRRAIEYQKKYEEFRRTTTANEQGKEPEAPPKPENRTKDYDFYIQMLTSHTATTIKISEALFKRLFYDKWDWTYQHHHALMFYAKAGGPGSADLATMASAYER